MTKEEMMKGLRKAQYYQQLAFGVLSTFQIYSFIDGDDGESFISVFFGDGENCDVVNFYHNKDYKECIKELTNSLSKFGVL